MIIELKKAIYLRKHKQILFVDKLMDEGAKFECIASISPYFHILQELNTNEKMVFYGRIFMVYNQLVIVHLIYFSTLEDFQIVSN